MLLAKDADRMAADNLGRSALHVAAGAAFILFGSVALAAIPVMGNHNVFLVKTQFVSGCDLCRSSLCCDVTLL
jgi:hypothetical protein